MKLRYIVLVGVLFLAPLLSHAFKSKRGGFSPFLPPVIKKDSSKRPSQNPPKVEYDINGSTEEIENLAFGAEEGFGAEGDTVTEKNIGSIVVGERREENDSWLRKSITAASKFVVNLFPAAKAEAFKDKVTALNGAFRNAINESATWDPDTRNNLGKLIKLSERVGVPEAIEQVKGIPKEDTEAQRAWVDDMTCKCNPALCPI